MFNVDVLFQRCECVVLYMYVLEGNGGAPGYYDSASESSGPPLEAVVTIPIHPGAGGGARSRSKASRYIQCYINAEYTLWTRTDAGLIIYYYNLHLEQTRELTW